MVKESKFEHSKEDVGGFFSGYTVTKVVMESTGFWWPVYERYVALA